MECAVRFEGGGVRNCFHQGSTALPQKAVTKEALRENPILLQKLAGFSISITAFGTGDGSKRTNLS